MKFYEIDNALQEAIAAGDKPVRLRIEIQTAGHFESVFEKDIIEAHFFGLKEAAGGTSARGEITINNEQLTMSNEGIRVGAEVRVSFSMGEGLPYFQRFVFYIDEKGIQDVRGPGRKRRALIGLRDLSYKLRKTDQSRDWTTPAVFAYSVVCDKTQPEKSLVHGIAQRAGLGANDIDCSTIPVTLPYVKLNRDIWSELSGMATAFRCHLECAPEKPLVFAHSPYQTNEKLTINNEQSSDDIYLIKGEDIFYLRKIQRHDLYRNTVRLKVNMPVVLDRQEIWRYGDPPVMYDEFLQAHYPFKYPLVREIETGKYEARYKIKDLEGKERNVIYADQIDTQEEAENRLEYDGGTFAYSHYDVTTNHDRAILTLQKESDGDLYRASIYGRPIILDINRSCFMRDIEQVNTFGTVALNVSGSYFSEYPITRGNITIAHYEDWVIRELEERLQNRREFTVKTHRGLFNARVGAKVQLTMNNEQLTGVINAFSFRYRKEKAFVASFKIGEQGTINNEQ
jgi:hypothetical protein